jgi:hypothetical protein
MDLPQEVICINDQDRPNEIPLSKWVKKGKVYTVIRIVKMVIQGGYGVQLEEIDLSDCYPYQFFGAYRFTPLHEEPLKEALDVLETPVESK